jgi:hypothetical protein
MRSAAVHLLWTCSLAGACFFADRWVILHSPVEAVLSVRLTVGLGIAALMRWGVRLVAGVFLGVLIAQLASGAAVVVTLAQAVGDSAGVLLGRFLLSRRLGGRLFLERVGDIRRLFVAGLLAPLPGVVCTGCAAILAEPTSPFAFPILALTHWQIGRAHV